MTDVNAKHDHKHGACSHDHDHSHGDDAKEEEKKEEEKKEPEIDAKQLISEKEKAIKETLSAISNGLHNMPATTASNITLVEKEFTDLAAKLETRRFALIKALREIEMDKKDILNQQVLELEKYAKTLEIEKAKDTKDIKFIDEDVSLRTPPQIILNIDNNKLSQIINKMGDLNNTFAPPPPIVNITQIKAHTCKVAFVAGLGKYDGYQTPNTYIVDMAFAPKNKHSQTENDQKIDFEALKWKQIAKRENVSFIRVKKLKPSTIYYVRVKCKNAYGWSRYCTPIPLKTFVLKINTKIMTSDEIQILIDLIKEKRQKKSLEWKLLFRGSDDGFLASTFHLKCDDMANTLCVIESNHGNVFGGFTRLPWKSDVGRYHVDEEAFVYIVRKKKRALKKATIYLQYTSSQHSVVHNKYMGPVFGYGHDIYIRNKADTVSDNSCRNHTYQCSYAGELAGEEKFRVINYEVFQISHPGDDVEEVVEDEESDDEDGDSED